jgi:hypothetical protein
MTRYPDTVAMKKAKEKNVSEMEYESTLDWRFMKRLRSETSVRHWHVKVHTGEMNSRNQPIYDDYNIIQTWVHRIGERLMAYPASRSGRPVDLKRENMIFEKRGANHLHGIEYLLRHLEGEDITELQLPLE